MATQSWHSAAGDVTSLPIPYTGKRIKSYFFSKHKITTPGSISADGLFER